MTAAELNELHRSVYAKRAVMMEQFFRDPLLSAVLSAELAIENIRQTPAEFRRTLEEILFNYAQHGAAVLKRQAARGGRAEKADELTKFIRAQVQNDPGISEAELLKVLRASRPLQWVDDVTEDRFELTNCKNIKISGLKDRLSRAKKEFAKRAER